MTATLDRPLGDPGSSQPRPVHHAKTINLVLKVWRQNGPRDAGRFENYKAEGISEVIVNGEVLYRDGRHTGALPGTVLRSQ